VIREGLAAIEDHDVCIVGAGPVGISLALELARLGRRVLLLESGGDRAEPETQALSDAAIVDPARHDPMAIAVARRLGGASNLWGGRCLPYDPIDFETRHAANDTRWPIGFDDVAPFLESATRYAVAGAPVFRTEPLTPNERAFTTSALERWSARRRLQEAHRDALASSDRIDVRLHATLVELEWSDERIAAVIAVDRAGARIRIPVACLVVAIGGLESTRLLLAEQMRRPAAFGGAAFLGRFYMGHIIGEIADVVFASDLVDEAFDFAIDAHGSYVRRRIAPTATTLREGDLLNCAFWPVVPRIADAAHRDGFLSAIALGLSAEPLGRRIISEAIRKRHIPERMARAPHAANILRDLPGTAVGVPRLLWRRYGARIPVPAFYKRNAARRYGLAYHSEQSPRTDSRVTLGAERDATGLPRLVIDLRFARADAERLVQLHERLETWISRDGLGTLHFRTHAAERVDAILDQASHGTHQIGTARMGANARDGVVDSDLRAFGTTNLFVLSSAVLPTSSQANPTLTVMALGMRLAAHLDRGMIAGVA
jgi:choline dehydrogenase-like flavoprotein